MVAEKIVRILNLQNSIKNSKKTILNKYNNMMKMAIMVTS